MAPLRLSDRLPHTQDIVHGLDLHQRAALDDGIFRSHRHVHRRAAFRRAAGKIRGRNRMRCWIVGASLSLMVVTAESATFTVTNTNDSGAGSLRNAVAAANAAPDADTIVIEATGTIVLTSGQIPINGPLTIVGPGADNLTIDAQAKSRIFSIYLTSPVCTTPPTYDGADYLVSIAGITLTNALRNSDHAGGAIFTEHSLTLDSVVIKDSVATSGAGVHMALQYAGQALRITKSQFINNTARTIVLPTSWSHNSGAAVHLVNKCSGMNPAPVTLSIADSLFVGNRVQPTVLIGHGGAIANWNRSADITITDTRIVDNHVEPPDPPLANTSYNGGGIWTTATSLRIERSEVSENTARTGAGIRLYNDASDAQVPAALMTAKIVDSTISGNTAVTSGGGMLVLANVALELDNSTVVGNSITDASASASAAGGLMFETSGSLATPTVNVVSSIVADNAVPKNLSADIGSTVPQSGAFTIRASDSLIEQVGQTPGGTIPLIGSRNLLGVDPKLGALVFNGGPTRTHALLPGSPALDNGSNPLGLTTDQRGSGFPRGQGAVDIGAFEAGGPPVIAAVSVVEYYNQALDHYFITWIPDELKILDRGVQTKGWKRTGYTFKAYPTLVAGASPVCRFYIPPGLGDSHFFGRGQAECDSTALKFPSFTLEDPRFMYTLLPLSGTCPANTTKIYRVFSNRADANHRYITDKAVRNQMVTKGWLAEGDGPDLVVMCAPS